jgi:hypothetical protein
MYGYMYLGCDTQGGLVSVIGMGGMCQGLHWDSVPKPDLRLVLWVRQVAVAARMGLY